MTDLADLLVTALLNHGTLALGATLFLAALGVPLPASMMLIAAGAFARQGVLGAPDTAVAALAGAVLGDSGSDGIGRFGSTRYPWPRYLAAGAGLWLCRHRCLQRP